MSEEVVKEQTGTEEKKESPKAVLLNAISYGNQEDYEKFLENLDVNQSIFVLIASANYAQTRGAFNLDESELIARAIKKIKNSSSNKSDESKEVEDSKNDQ
jgi:hypothetical protein